MAGWPTACSGDRYCAVPITWPVRGERHLVAGPGDAEVGDLDASVGRDQQVGRLDVAVHDAAVVGGCSAGRGLLDQRATVGRGGQRAVAGQIADSGSPSTSSITR